MRSFAMQIQEASRMQRIDGVTSFIGEDGSGCFGIRAGHERLLTCLVFGLARYQCGEAAWQYLAMPGGLLYFADNRLTVSARRIVADPDYQRITAALQQQLLAEEEALHEIKSSLHRLEEEMLKRLWRLSRSA